MGPMEPDRIDMNLVRNIIYALCVILTVCLVVLLFKQRQEEQNYTEQIAVMHEEALPYEYELNQIQKELEEMDQKTTFENEIGRIMIGYQVDADSDYSMIAQQALKYDFIPAIVMEPDIKQTDTILEKIDNKGYNLILTGAPDNMDIRKGALNIKDLVKTSDYDIDDTGCFLLRKTDDNEENLEAIAEDKYKGCIRYANEAEPGVLDSGLISFNYSQIKNNNFDVTQKLKELVSDNGILLFVFDLTDDNLNKETVEKDLEKMYEQICDKSLKLCTIESVLKKIGKIHKEESHKEQHNKAFLKKQDRLEELQKKIDEIYSKWDGERD